MNAPLLILIGYLAGVVTAVLAMAYAQSVEFRTSVKAELRSLWDAARSAFR